MSRKLVRQPFDGLTICQHNFALNIHNLKAASPRRLLMPRVLETDDRSGLRERGGSKCQGIVSGVSRHGVFSQCQGAKCIWNVDLAALKMQAKDAKTREVNQVTVVAS